MSLNDVIIYNYVFGYKCKFGNWESFIISEKHIPQIENLINKLK